MHSLIKWLTARPELSCGSLSSKELEITFSASEMTSCELITSNIPSPALVDHTANHYILMGCLKLDLPDIWHCDEDIRVSSELGLLRADVSKRSRD